MTKKEILKLVKLCSYPELQKLWRPEFGDQVARWNVIEWGITYIPPKYSIKFAKEAEFIWLPRIEDVACIMSHECKGIRWANFRIADILRDTSELPRIACLRALKATLKGG